MKKEYILTGIGLLTSSLIWLSPALAFPPWEDSRESNYRDDYYDSREERYIAREKDRLELDRERLESERAQFNAERRYKDSLEQRPTAPPVAARAERCPSGFVPSEQKCTGEERKHGCKDIRLPGGLGCVHRRS